MNKLAVDTDFLSEYQAYERQFIDNIRIQNKRLQDMGLPPLLSDQAVLNQINQQLSGITNFTDFQRAIEEVNNKVQ